MKRELKSYFTTSLGYSIYAILTFLGGILYIFTFLIGRGTLANTVFLFMLGIILLITPILTMRLFSEERRQKTDQLLFTSSVKLSSIVLGKFFAAVIFFVTFFVLMIVYQVVLSFFAKTDWIIFFSSLLGMFLYTVALITIGMFISSLTESQIVSALVSFLISFFFIILWIAQSLVEDVLTVFFPTMGWLSTSIGWISFSARNQAFLQGIFNYSDVIYFISITGLFLFLTVRVLDKKRWA